MELRVFDTHWAALWALKGIHGQQGLSFALLGKLLGYTCLHCILHFVLEGLCSCLNDMNALDGVARILSWDIIFFFCRRWLFCLSDRNNKSDFSVIPYCVCLTCCAAWCDVEESVAWDIRGSGCGTGCDWGFRRVWEIFRGPELIQRQNGILQTKHDTSKPPAFAGSSRDSALLHYYSPRDEILFWSSFPRRFPHYSRIALPCCIGEQHLTCQFESRRELFHGLHERFPDRYTNHWEIKVYDQSLYARKELTTL